MLTLLELSHKIQLKIYNALGEEVINTIISNESTQVETTNLPSGLYFYNVINENGIIQSGKLVSKN